MPRIGKTVSGEQLSEEYDAVVLCCGARKPRTVAGADYSVKGVLPAVEYLTASTKAVLTGKKSTCSAEARDVIVIGNGDTATDCVATAVRQKARSVIQLVRKPRAESVQRVWPNGNTVTKRLKHITERIRVCMRHRWSGSSQAKKDS